MEQLRQSQANETQADNFALDLIRRTGDLPVGIFQYFTTTFFLNPYTDDPATVRSRSTHPLSSDRIRNMANHLYTNSSAYTHKPDRPTPSVRVLADQLQELADWLDDPAIRQAARLIGYSGSIDRLRAQPAKTDQRPGRFTGSFSGDWISPKKNKMRLTLDLIQTGQAVRGTGQLADGLPFRITWGVVDKQTLDFNWEMGTNRFGRGKLRADASGRTLSGSWGTDQGNTFQNAGQLVLVRKK